jgi:hypothetical protein
MKPAICARCTADGSGAARSCGCGRPCCKHLIGKDGKCGPCRIGEYNAKRKAAKAAGGAP